MSGALEKLDTNGMFISELEILRIAKKYQIKKIEAFGSVLRPDFSSESDVDLLISFYENAEISLFDLMDLESELSELFNRPVDIIEPAALKNPIRKKNILSSSELIYAA